jgi:hypothetical protein
VHHAVVPPHPGTHRRRVSPDRDMTPIDVCWNAFGRTSAPPVSVRGLDYTATLPPADGGREAVRRAAEPGAQQPGGDRAVGGLIASGGASGGAFGSAPASGPRGNAGREGAHGAGLRASNVDQFADLVARVGAGYLMIPVAAREPLTGLATVRNTAVAGAAGWQDRLVP